MSRRSDPESREEAHVRTGDSNSAGKPQDEEEGSVVQHSSRPSRRRKKNHSSNKILRLLGGQGLIDTIDVNEQLSMK